MAKKYSLPFLTKLLYEAKFLNTEESLLRRTLETCKKQYNAIHSSLTFVWGNMLTLLLLTLTSNAYYCHLNGLTVLTINNSKVGIDTITHKLVLFGIVNNLNMVTS